MRVQRAQCKCRVHSAGHDSSPRRGAPGCTVWRLRQILHQASGCRDCLLGELPHLSEFPDVYEGSVPRVDQGVLKFAERASRNAQELLKLAMVESREPLADVPGRRSRRAFDVRAEVAIARHPRPSTNRVPPTLQFRTPLPAPQIREVMYTHAPAAGRIRARAPATPAHCPCTALDVALCTWHSHNAPCTLHLALAPLHKPHNNQIR